MVDGGVRHSPLRVLKGQCQNERLCMIEMPPKASRVFTVDPLTGEVRCGDPSCNITQCGQCNTEQNKRKKEKRRQEAEQAKAAQAEREREKARRDVQDGKQYQWTYDKDDDNATDASVVMQQLQTAQAVQEQQDKVEQEEDRMVAEADERGRQGQAEADEREREAPAAPNDAGKKGAGKRGASDGRTKWNHTTRTLLYRAIMKFNPFSAPVKKDAWAKISEEMATATAGMNDRDKGDFRVKTDGHGLEVFYDRQIENMDKKTANEDSTSGQTGADVTAEEKEEFGLLAGCRAKEKDAALIKQRKRDVKQALEDLRNNEVNDAVRQAALSDKPVQIKLYRVLQTRVRAAKLEAATWTKNNPGLGQYAYSVANLKDIEEFQNLKDTHGDLTGNTDSDLAADTKGSDDPEAMRMKGGKVAVAIAAIAAKLPDAKMFAPPDFSLFATSFYAAKRAAEGAMPPSQAPKRTLKERLAEVEENLAAEVITQKEADDFSAKIKKAFFMRDD